MVYCHDECYNSIDSKITQFLKQYFRVCVLNSSLVLNHKLDKSQLRARAHCKYSVYYLILWYTEYHDMKLFIHPASVIHSGSEA